MIKTETIYDGAFYSQFVKLLAQENIKRTVKADAETAYFNLEERLLVIPAWHETLSENVRKLLHAHEVGHAVYTPINSWHDSVKALKLHSYLNIVEDARIDVLMTKRYRGLIKSYREGYKELFEEFFFHKYPYEELISLDSFINRFNLFFKLGESYGVPIQNDVEWKFIEEGRRMKTFADVVRLTKKLIKYDAAEHKNINQNQSFVVVLNNNPDEDGEEGLGPSTVMDMFDEEVEEMVQEEVDKLIEEFKDFAETLDDETLEKLMEQAKDANEKIMEDGMEKPKQENLSSKSLFDGSHTIISMDSTFTKFDNYITKLNRMPTKL